MSIVAVSFGASDAPNRQWLSLANRTAPSPRPLLRGPSGGGNHSQSRQVHDALRGSSSACTGPRAPPAEPGVPGTPPSDGCRRQNRKSGDKLRLTAGSPSKAGRTEQRERDSRCPQNRTRNSSSASTRNTRSSEKLSCPRKILCRVRAVGDSRIGGANGVRPSPRRYAKDDLDRGTMHA